MYYNPTAKKLETGAVIPDKCTLLEKKVISSRKERWRMSREEFLKHAERIVADEDDGGDTTSTGPETEPKKNDTSRK